MDLSFRSFSYRYALQICVDIGHMHALISSRWEGIEPWPSGDNHKKLIIGCTSGRPIANILGSRTLFSPPIFGAPQVQDLPSGTSILPVIMGSALRTKSGPGCLWHASPTGNRTHNLGVLDVAAFWRRVWKSRPCTMQTLHGTTVQLSA